jgi:hypothetical protein
MLQYLKANHSNQSLIVVSLLTGFLLMFAAAAYAATYDGPAELPRVYVQSALTATPSPGKTWSVPAGASVQQAINSAACGDTVSLQAGATFKTSLYLPAKPCDNQHWITIRTSAPNSALPAPGTRLTPCYAGVSSLPGRPALNCKSVQKVVATILSPGRGGTAAVFVNNGANHYRLIGLEITRTTVGNLTALINVNASYVASYLVFDRLWIHGTPHDDTARAVGLGGSNNVAILDSYINDLHCTAGTGGCVDSQAISGGVGSNHMGPYQIVDNFLEASGENIMFGGGGATTAPADIEIRRNHFYKPLVWKKGTPGFISGNSANPNIVKNLFELKNAQRVLLDGNIMEYTWGGFSQAGYAILLAPKNQASGTTNICPACQVTDVTIRYTTISHVAAGFQIANAASANGGAPYAGERYSIHDVVVDDISTKYAGPGLFALVAMLGNNMPVLQYVRFNHVTAFAPQMLLSVGDLISSPKMVNFVLQNSIVTTGPYPIWSTGGTSNCAISDKPLTVLANCFNPYTFTHNALVGSPAVFSPTIWPAGNYFPATTSTVQFVSYNGGTGGNYQLLSTSPYKSAGTDGKDLGADLTALRTAIASVY